ncbi:MAG: hypothetical protein K9J27_05320 [Bacteroidales bacterium]|nr:hypothetical protein [Bacteroidales bacterium]
MATFTKTQNLSQLSLSEICLRRIRRLAKKIHASGSVGEQESNDLLYPKLGGPPSDTPLSFRISDWNNPFGGGYKEKGALTP